MWPAAAAAEAEEKENLVTCGKGKKGLTWSIRATRCFFSEDMFLKHTKSPKKIQELFLSKMPQGYLMGIREIKPAFSLSPLPSLSPLLFFAGWEKAISFKRRAKISWGDPSQLRKRKFESYFRGSERRNTIFAAPYCLKTRVLLYSMWNRKKLFGKCSEEEADAFRCKSGK